MYDLKFVLSNSFSNELSKEFISAWLWYDNDHSVEQTLWYPDGFPAFCMLDV